MASVTRVVTYKPRSTAIENEFELPLYERNVQVADLTATNAALLIDVVHTNLPEGVSLVFKVHERSDEEAKYIPDLDLKALQEQLREMDKEAAKRKDM